MRRRPPLSLLALLALGGCRLGFDECDPCAVGPDVEVLTPEPRFSGAPGFTDWIENDGATPTAATGAPCNGDLIADGGPRAGQELGRRACLQAGLFQQVVVARSSCTGLSARDSLDALVWTCEERDGDAVMISTRLTTGRSLRDLVDAAGWIPLAIEVRRVDVLIAQSPAAALWPNPVVALDEVVITGGATGVDGVTGVVSGTEVISLELGAPGTIYTLGIDRSLPSVTLAAAGVGFATLGTATLSWQGTLPGCLRYMPTPDAQCAVAANPAASYGVIAVAVDTNIGSGVLARRPAFLTVSGSVRNAPEGIVLVEGVASLVEGADLRNVRTGVEVVGGRFQTIRDVRVTSTGGGNGVGITGGDHHSVAHTAVVGGFDNFVVQDSADVRLHDVESANSSQFGVRIFGLSPRAILTDVVATNNGLGGIHVSESAHDTTLVGALVANSVDEGIIFDGVDRVTMSHLTALANEQFGVSPYLGADFASVSQINAANNGYYGLFVRGSKWGLYAQIAISNNGLQQARIYQNSDFNVFTRAFIGGPGAMCLVDGGGTDNNTVVTDDIMGLCGGDDAALDFRTANGMTQATTFAGLVTTDATNAHQATLAAMQGLDAAQITDWLDFDHPLRYWGQGANVAMLDGSNRIKCTTPALCRAWDARIVAGNPFFNTSGTGTTMNEPFVDGMPCPSAIHGDYTTQSLRGIEVMADGLGDDDGVCEPLERCTGQDVFVTNARELLEDDIGDDDGLCESAEACVYSPHFGYYQGLGDPLTGPSCTFVDGTGAFAVSGVTMYAHPTL